jgi:hypothetical protein
MATSSATRSGLSWMGSTLPRKTILPFRLRCATEAPMTLTDGIMLSGLLWCSLIMTPSKPVSEAYCSSSKYMA